MTKQEKKEPLARLRLGRVEAAIWENEGKSGPFYSVTIHRSYRDGDRYKTAYSFDNSDLANVNRLSDWAFARITEIQQGDLT